ncbi:MAG: formylglycine-generating enzyme family protein [Rugosibacter sp.]|nr:formylglycine-generating enzyme family protein [Rugosibacter sp.]
MGICLPCGGKLAYCGGEGLATVAWYDENGGKRPHPVADKQGNTFNLHDMSGNVWEWVEDCWHDSYRGAPDDGSAWVFACNSGDRVLRGGSWYTFASQARASGRNAHPPADRHYLNGFRVARTRLP